MGRKTFYVRYMKRILDVICSGIMLIILSPVLIIVGILIKTKLGSPIIFIQKRPGKDNKVFDMYKFRTMTNKRDELGNLLPDDKRLTYFGKFLRSTSLDELPELLNILKGDMSIVGPRPQLIKDEWFMSEKEKNRHSVLPGLTGWAQINGRNAISWEKKFEYDLYYIQNISFLFDLTIIIKTIVKVFLKSDISSEGFETAEDLGDYLLRTGKIKLKQYNKIMNTSQKEST